MMLSNLLTAALIAAALIMAGLAFACALLLPLRARGVESELVVRVERGAKGLEHLLRGAALIAGVAGVRVRIECSDSETTEFLRRIVAGWESVMYICEGDPDG